MSSFPNDEPRRTSPRATLCEHAATGEQVQHRDLCRSNSEQSRPTCSIAVELVRHPLAPILELRQEPRHPGLPSKLGCESRACEVHTTPGATAQERADVARCRHPLRHVSNSPPAKHCQWEGCVTSKARRWLILLRHRCLVACRPLIRGSRVQPHPLPLASTDLTGLLTLVMTQR